MASTEPSPGGAPLPTGHPFGFDEMSMQLILRGVPARLYTFGDNPDVPWFPGKPILVFLGYANPKQAYERLDDDEKSSLKDLIAKKGPPRFEVGSFKEPTLGYNDLKATYISEPGLYTVILGSKKPEAKVFKKWVTSEVLPSIRRLGKYSFHDRRSPDDGAPPPPHRLQLEWDFTRKLEEFQLAVLENNKALVTQLADTKKALAVHDEASARRLEALEERLEASQRNTLRQLAAEFTKQLSVSVVFALQKLSRTLSQALPQALSEALTRTVGEQLTGELSENGVDTTVTLGAVHDFLKWIGLDKDGRHNDWNHWLGREVCKEIAAYNNLLNLRGCCTLRFLCILRFVILPGESVETPVGNVLVYRVITRLCVGMRCGERIILEPPAPTSPRSRE